MEDQAEIEAWFDAETPNAEVQPLFDLGPHAGDRVPPQLPLPHPRGASLQHRDPGRARQRDRGQVPQDPLSGHRENETWRPFQHLDKRCFEKGALGFDAFGGKLGMCICNDRRWPEIWRVLGLGAGELFLLGDNTPLHYPPAPAPEHDHLQYSTTRCRSRPAATRMGIWP